MCVLGTVVAAETAMSAGGCWRLQCCCAAAAAAKCRRHRRRRHKRPSKANEGQPWPGTEPLGPACSRGRLEPPRPPLELGLAAAYQWGTLHRPRRWPGPPSQDGAGSRTLRPETANNHNPRRSTTRVTSGQCSGPLAMRPMHRKTSEVTSAQGGDSWPPRALPSQKPATGGLAASSVKGVGPAPWRR